MRAFRFQKIILITGTNAIAIAIENTPVMAASMPNTNLLLQPILLGFIGILVVSAIKMLFNSPHLKGMIGEARVKKITSQHLDSQTYRQIHNVTLPTADGTTQLDHIIVSEFGIFVIETKNMSGWIFGAEHASTWTQTLGRRKHTFQNPLRQNYKHIKELSLLLQIPENKIFSVIALVGNAEFKTDRPDNVVHANRLSKFILSHNQVLLEPSEIQRALALIHDSMLDRGIATDRLHISHLNAKHGTKGRTWQDELKFIGLKFAGMTAVLFAGGMFILSSLSSVTTPLITANVQPAPVSQPAPPVATAPPSRQPMPQPTPSAPATVQTQPQKTPRSPDYGFLTVSA